MPILSVSNLLGWSLQVALLVAAAALASRLMPVDSAAVRHAWWRAVLVVCLALPMVQPWRPAMTTLAVGPPIESVVPADAGPTATSLLHPAFTTPGFGMTLRSWSVLATILALGALVRLA